MPRIVLPITGRGLALTDRVCWAVLAVAMASAVGLILYLNRGTTFNIDELNWAFDSPELGPGDVLDPYNGHLIAVTRFLYKAILETLGVGYLPFRILGALTVALCGGLFFAVARLRVGALPALAPTLVLLFFGSAGTFVVAPLGFNILFSIAAGLAAVLALERGDTRGDIAACALIILSVATFSTGLAFLVGVAISVLLRADRWRRAWIFLIPLALYAVWWLWSLAQPGSAQGAIKLSNALLIPSYVADSLAAALAAIAGLDYDFGGAASSGVIALDWGLVLAVPAVAALILRIRRVGMSRSLWASLGTVLVFWALGALAFSIFRPPETARYVYMGAVGALLVATDAARGARFSRFGVAALFAAAAFSLATNLALMRDSGAAIRDFADRARAEFTAIELARDRVDPGFVTPSALQSELRLTPRPASDFLAMIDRYGSPGFSVAELGGQSEDVRENADRILANALELRLEPSRGAGADCRGQRGAIELAPGGAV
ncbi:MAG: hypothetical protein ACRDGW_09910, partial [Actinomycetota bacterium]